MPFDDKRNAGMTAKRIKYARTCANMTQSDVALCLNITPQQISNYERGLTRVPDNVILKMAELYGVSADFILGISGEVPLPDDLQIVLGDAAENLAQGEGQAAIELYGIFNSFIKYIGTEHKSALPAAAGCMEAATLCFAHLCEKCSGNIDDLRAGEFAGIALKEIDRMQDVFARFALTLQAGISEICATDKE